jgi:hypothetical protein
MLVEEIDRLQIELWHARLQPSVGERVATEGSLVGEEEPVASSLHARLQRVLRREAAAEPVEQSGSATEGDTTISPEAWIDALRRQK